MKSKRRFNLDLLNSFCKEYGLQLIGVYDKLNSKSLITGKCLLCCQDNFTKTFYDVVDKGGPFCKECTKKSQNNNQKKEEIIVKKKLSSLEIFNKTKDGRYKYGEINFETQPEEPA